MHLFLKMKSYSDVLEKIKISEVKLLIFLTGDQYECVSFIRKTDGFEYCSSTSNVGGFVLSIFFFSKIDGDTLPPSNFMQLHIVVITP